MKYVLFVWFLSVNGDGLDPGDYNPVQMELEYESQEACEEAIPEVEELLSLEHRARAYTIQCRPATVFD